MLAHTPAMLECHYGVRMGVAFLHSIYTRLDAAIFAFQFDHAKAKFVIVDREIAPLMTKALSRARVALSVILCDNPEYTGPCTLDHLSSRLLRSRLGMISNLLI